MAKRSKERYIPRGIRQIMAVLYLFLNRYSLGLYPFTNRIPFPETPEIAEMVSIARRGGDPGCHIDGGEKLAAAQRIVESADHIRDIIRRNGGLDVYCDTFEWYERECPERMGILRDLSMLRSPEFMTKMHVASAHNMSVRTMDREVDKAMIQISNEIYRRGHMHGSEETQTE